MWLIAFGLVDAYLLLWVGDILYAYGIVGLFLYPLRKWRARTLIALGVLALFVMTLKDGVYDYYHHVDLSTQVQVAQATQAAGGTSTAEQQQAVAEWQEVTGFAKPPAEVIAAYSEGMRGNYVNVFVTQLPALFYFQVIDFLPNGFFDVLGMMLIGMGLFKAGAFTMLWSASRYWLTAAVGYAIGIGANAWEVQTILSANFNFLGIEKANITYDLGRLGVAFGHIAIVMLACKLGWLSALRARLAAVGQMALTNYLTQSIFLALTFTGVGLGLFGQLARAELYYFVVVVWIVQLVWSPIWLRHFRFGPAEWLWRSLTYWRWQPMRLGARTTEAVAT